MAFLCPERGFVFERGVFSVVLGIADFGEVDALVHVVLVAFLVTRTLQHLVQLGQFLLFLAVFVHFVFLLAKRTYAVFLILQCFFILIIMVLV